MYLAIDIPKVYKEIKRVEIPGSVAEMMEIPGSVAEMMAPKKRQLVNFRPKYGRSRLMPYVTALKTIPGA